jgi:cytochrome P450
MVAPLFTREHIDGMRPQIQETVDSLIDAMIKEGSQSPLDIVDKLALPVASYVSLRGLGTTLTKVLISTLDYIWHSRCSAEGPPIPHSASRNSIQWKCHCDRSLQCQPVSSGLNLLRVHQMIW